MFCFLYLSSSDLVHCQSSHHKWYITEASGRSTQFAMLSCLHSYFSPITHSAMHHTPRKQELGEREMEYEVERAR